MSYLSFYALYGNSFPCMPLGMVSLSSECMQVTSTQINRYLYLFSYVFLLLINHLQHRQNWSSLPLGKELRLLGKKLLVWFGYSANLVTLPGIIPPLLQNYEQTNICHKNHSCSARLEYSRFCNGKRKLFSPDERRANAHRISTITSELFIWRRAQRQPYHH